MLHEMRQSALIIIFHDGANFIREIKLDPVFGLCVFPDIIGKPVGKLTGPDVRIEGNFLICFIGYSRGFGFALTRRLSIDYS